MLIDRLTLNLMRSKTFTKLIEKTQSGEDVSLGIAGLARPFLIAALFAHDPRPMFVVVSGEEAAQRLSRQIAAYLGRKRVLHFPERKDLPWASTSIDVTVVGKRTKALYALSQERPVVVVASARSLLRTVAPQGSDVLSPLTFAIGDEIEFETLAEEFVRRGYTRSERADEPGMFALRGDILDVYAPDAFNPIRIDFFGDEVEMIRTFIPSSGQIIAPQDRVELYPCREMSVSARGLAGLKKAFEQKRMTDKNVARDLELFEENLTFAGMEKYLPYVYKKVGSPIDHIGAKTLMVVAEPRSLFDDSRRAYEDLVAQAASADASLDGLFLSPAKLDFGEMQRLTLASIVRAGTPIDLELVARRPEVEGEDERFVHGVTSLVQAGYAVAVTSPERKVREKLALLLSEGGISISSKDFDHRREPGEDEHGEPLRAQLPKPLEDKIAKFDDLDLASGFVIPEARLAIICESDITPRSRLKKLRKIADPTKTTFSYAPGDYVVHATHGIALFKETCKQEIAGVERDYLLLEYASGDHLYVPVDQIDRVTKYVGAKGEAPKLTRLNTTSWARAVGKARKAAKQLAFDLVDLYARRSTVSGFMYAPDTPAQHEMEEAFLYEETPDQISAIADVKEDMESDKPMDRLICGDVGFGKTEVALRAAFKATQNDKQVMVLCPTTILAQQQYTTFSERFEPFGVHVEVLSRFRTEAQQKEALRGFSEGSVQVIVGTHRLLSRDVISKDLGLVIVDEEQRFGVGHKEQIKNLREQVDVLTLSATPIPRTLQMSLSGVRDMSVIDTPPASRTPIKVHVGEWDEDVVSGAIRRELARGGQVYYVSNRVKTIDDAVRRVMEAAPEARIGVGHGQMSEHELESVMERFAANEIDVLVATTIIESGLDNPHSNTLIIEDSQRLGLAQLYQLKGRVGRSHAQAYAYFLFPRNSSLTEQAIDRLTAIGDYQGLGSGIKVAMRDLEIRGAGSLLGAEQHGNMSAIGFDLFAQMLGEAVGEARGEAPIAYSEVKVDLPVHAYLPADYIENADVRVVFYRRIAAALTVETVDAVTEDIKGTYGAMPDAAKNLLGISKVKALAADAGVTHVTVIRGRLVFAGVHHLSKETKAALAVKGTLYTEKSKKLTYPLGKDDDPIEVARELLGILAND